MECSSSVRAGYQAKNVVESSRAMVECSRLIKCHVEPWYNGVEPWYSVVEPSRAMVVCSRVK